MWGNGKRQKHKSMSCNLSEKVQCIANKASINHVTALITPRNKTNKDDSFNYITSNKKG